MVARIMQYFTLNLCLVFVALVSLTQCSSSQSLEWHIYVPELPSPGYGGQIVAKGNGIIYCSIGTEQDSQIVARIDIETHNVSSAWSSQDYVKRIKRAHFYLENHDSGILINSDRGLGILGPSGSFLPMFESCNDTLLGPSSVRVRPNGRLDVLANREQFPVVNLTYFRSSAEQWKDDTCISYFSQAPRSGYGTLAHFNFDDNGNLLMAHENRTAGSTALLRYRNGDPIVIAGLEYPEVRYVRELWRDSWGWTVFFDKVSPSVDYSIARLTVDFELIDEAFLGKPSFVTAVRRNGNRVIATAMDQVVVVIERQPN